MHLRVVRLRRRICGVYSRVVPAICDLHPPKMKVLFYRHTAAAAFHPSLSQLMQRNTWRILLSCFLPPRPQLCHRLTERPRLLRRIFRSRVRDISFFRRFFLMQLLAGCDTLCVFATLQFERGERKGERCTDCVCPAILPLYAY